MVSRSSARYAGIPCATVLPRGQKHPAEADLPSTVKSAPSPGWNTPLPSKRERYRPTVRTNAASFTLHRPGTLPRGTGMPYGVVPLAAGERILDQVVFTPLHRCGAFPPAHHQALYPALVDRAPVQGAQTPLRPFRNLAAEQTGVSPLELYGAAFPWTQQILGSVLQSGYSQKAPSHSLADGTTDDRRLGKPCLGFSFSQCQGTSLLGPEIPENPVPGRVLRDSFSENSLIAYCLSGIFYLESPLEYSGTVSCALKKGS